MTMQIMKSALLASLLLTATSGMVTAQMRSGEQDSQRHMGEARSQTDRAGDVTRPEMPEWITPEMLQTMMRMMGDGAMPGMMGRWEGEGRPWSGMMGQSMMGRGMMRGMPMDAMMYGDHGQLGGMMSGQGIGPGVIYGMPDQPVMEMTPTRVRDWVEQRLAWHDNPRLTLGDITEAEDGSIIAEIVTVDGSLVQRLAFNRYPGLFRQID